MTRKISFTKMHGAGNDYIYVNTFLYSIPDPSEAAREWSKPHTGIGSDGLVLIGKPKSKDADFSMRIFNADGSEALMCGNASRCIGKYLFEKKFTDKTSIKLETLSGIKTLELHLSNANNKNDQIVESVTVDMLEPHFNVPSQYVTDDVNAVERAVEINGQMIRGTFVSMGNPHFVVFVDDVSQFPVETFGKTMEHFPIFPQRCNIEFAQITRDNTIQTRVWERGSGITMACGTGACATAVAAALTKRSSRKSTILMDGGELVAEWKDDNHVYLTGPAEFVFEGSIELKDKD